MVTAAKARLRGALEALGLTVLYRVWHGLGRLNPRLLLRRAQFGRWNRGAARQEIVLRPGLRLRVEPRSREPFEWFCFRSLAMARELDAFAREIPARRRLLDVGACHGIFSLAFAHQRPEALAVAVEPSAIAYSILVENLRLNGIENVIATPVACGAASGTVRMRQTWHHLEALPEAPAPEDLRTSKGYRDDGAVVAIPMQSLDELCQELHFRPDLIKIDVEGYELAVLRGARATLGAHRPLLFLEIHPQRLSELGGSAAAVVALLGELGYSFRSMGGSPLSGQQVARRESVSRVLCTAGR